MSPALNTGQNDGPARDGKMRWHDVATVSSLQPPAWSCTVWGPLANAGFNR